MMSARKPFNAALDPLNPLGFLEKVFEFVAKESDLFKIDSLVNDVNAVVRMVKDKVETEEKKRKDVKTEGKSKAEKKDKEEAAAPVKKEEMKKDVKEEEKESESTVEEEKNWRRAPNKNNGLDIDKYSWGQSLQEVNIIVSVPPGTKSRSIACEIKKNHLKVVIKGQPPVIDGELFLPVKVEDCFWSLEDQKSISILLTKQNQMEWWKYLVKGEPETDTQKVEPDNSKLSDLDPETRSAVEKMVCHNGDILCSTCKTRAHNRYPTCRQELGDIRCLALENVAESLDLPCKYYSLGCSEIFPCYIKLKHEAVCNFRPYNCPYAGSECAVTGDIPFLVAHLRDEHKVDMENGCTFDKRYVKSNPREEENVKWMLSVFNCFGQYFCLHFGAFDLGMAPVYMAFVRFMGDEIEARNYSYCLEVGANGRKLIWQGTARSIRESYCKVRDSHDGLIIQRNMALFFSGGDRKELKLRVVGRIWKEYCNPNEVELSKFWS